MPSANQIRSEEVQDILSRPPHWMILWSNTLILIFLLLFIILSWFISYPDVISTNAIITSATPPQKEYAPSSGIIDTILVKDNDLVYSNQILAVIENTATLNHVLILKEALDTIQIQANTFQFPVNDMPLLSLGEIASVYAVFEKDYIDFALNKQLNPYANQAHASRLSEKQLRLRLESLKNQKKLDEKKFTLSKNEFDRNVTLYEKGVLSLNEFESRKIKFLEQEKQLKSLDITFSQINQSLNEVYANTKENEINNQIDNTRLFKNLIQSYTLLQDAIKKWELNYVLRSKMDGRLSFISIWNKTQHITAGDLLFTVVAETNESYRAKIKAPIKNSGKIRSGQHVNVKLLNYPETEYGMLVATIESMSAIPNEEGFYLVNASIDSSLITSYGIEIPFKNEMSGTAEIITEDLRLLERFFHQIKGIFN